jgi:hypothetical protein
MAEVDQLSRENRQQQQHLQQYVNAAVQLERVVPVVEPQPHQGGSLTTQEAAIQVLQLAVVMQQLEVRLKHHAAAVERHCVSSSPDRYPGEAWSSTVEVLSVAATEVAEVRWDLQQLGREMKQQSPEPTRPGVPAQQQPEDAERQWQHQEPGIGNPHQVRQLREMVSLTLAGL